MDSRRLVQGTDEVLRIAEAVVRDALGATPVAARVVVGGNSNHVVKVDTVGGTSFAVRISKVGPERFVVESAVIEAVTPAVPVPRVHFVGDVPGMPGVAVMASDWVGAPTIGAAQGGGPAERRAVARSLADVLAAIHSVPVTGFGNLDARLHGSEIGFADWFVSGATGRISASCDAIASCAPEAADLPQRALGILEAEVDCFGSPGSTLVHGDVSPGNLHVDASTIVAVIDWEAAKGGPPSLDLGWLRFVDPSQIVDHEALLGSYASATGADVDEMRRASALVELRILATMPEWQARASLVRDVPATVRRLDDAIRALS